MPQALRVIIPPMTSQYLNLTKNSSLAVAVGYQDIVSIANTTLNQTGQAIEAIALIMAVFLTISLGISLFMNWYNARIALHDLRDGCSGKSASLRSTTVA
jgi:general L-amino acid transport system permease protein